MSWHKGALSVHRDGYAETSVGSMQATREVVRLYVEPRDWWVGYFRGDDYHYVCPLPCLVIRWPRLKP